MSLGNGKFKIVNGSLAIEEAMAGKTPGTTWKRMFNQFTNKVMFFFFNFRNLNQIESGVTSIVNKYYASVVDILQSSHFYFYQYYVMWLYYYHATL